MSVTMPEIRAKFPRPQRQQTRKGEHAYCVGGAYCIFVGYTEHGFIPRFPEEHFLARALRASNPRLSSTVAQEYANRITDHNDYGRFSKAWRYLDKALTHGRLVDASVS
jgi:hypothetical protein